MEGLVLFFVIEVITHTQLGSCSLPRKDNIDLLAQPLHHPACHVCILFSTKELSCCAWQWLQAHGATHITAARSRFPEHERPASNSPWAVPALQHGRGQESCKAMVFLSWAPRAFPFQACWERPHSQPAREPEWDSSSDTGLLRWPDRRLVLNLRTPDTPQNKPPGMCSLQIWDQGLQWKAHHSNLPKDFGYHEGLN